MFNPALHLDDLPVFLSLCREGSISAAARQLGVSHTTVARRMKALETAIGAELTFLRGGTIISTKAGSEVLAFATRLEADLWQLTHSLRDVDDQVSGHLRLATTDILAAIYAPEIAEFGRRFPTVTLDIDISTDVIDLAGRQADVALRFAEPHDDTLVGRVVSKLEFGLYGSAAAPPADWSQTNWISYSGRGCARYTEPWRQSRVPRSRVSATIASPLLMPRLLRHGSAIGLLPKVLGDADEGLVCLEPDTGIALNVWALCPAETKASARVRAFFDVFATQKPQQAGNPQA